MNGNQTLYIVKLFCSITEHFLTFIRSFRYFVKTNSSEHFIKFTDDADYSLLQLGQTFRGKLSKILYELWSGLPVKCCWYFSFSVAEGNAEQEMSSLLSSFGGKIWASMNKCSFDWLQMCLKQATSFECNNKAVKKVTSLSLMSLTYWRD